MRRLLLSSLSLLAFLVLPSVAQADLNATDWYKDPQVNAKWIRDVYIQEPGSDVMLHADILRPKDLPDTAKTPVIMSIGPYFNHSAQTPDTPDNPAGTEAGPSKRFIDFVVGGKLMQRGYTYIMVDLRGYGGSTGCSDFGGAGEQTDVKDAVEWAASQPWSTGSVGLYGKSYDGVTGLIGEVTQPKGLAAIVSQEPVYDEYDYLYTNREKFANFAGTPALYQAIAADPGVVGADDPTYQINAFKSSPCYANAILQQSGDDNRDSDFWKQHNYTQLAKGHTVPLFLTQGYLEDNTKPLGAWGFYNAVAGPKRGWFTMSDHIRGNDQKEGDNSYPEFFDETMRWFDHYVRGVSLVDAPVDKDPANEVETNDRTWRAEGQWPAADTVNYAVPLKTGSYMDDSMNNGSAENANPGVTPEGDGLWTISPPLNADQRFSGVPMAHMDVTASLPNANLATNIYDIAPDGTALMLSRGTYLLSQGENKLDFEMYGNDWKIPAGHRIGLLVSSSNSEWWNYVPTNTPVVVNAGSTITVPFLHYARTATIPGKNPTRLAAWLDAAPFKVDAATITSGTSESFPRPTETPAAAPAGSPVTQTGTVTSPPPYAAKPGAVPDRPSRLTAHTSIARRNKGRRRITVYGTAPANAHLVIRITRGTKVLALRRVTTKLTAYRTTISLRAPKGTYRARVVATTAKTATLKAKTLRATSIARRVK